MLLPSATSEFLPKIAEYVHSTFSSPHHTLGGECGYYMVKFRKKQYSTLAIIPARGGSKGVPRKNVRPLGGRPLISYAITAAKKSRSVNRVIVSTDDPEIARVAKRYGAEVPFLRPAELAEDSTPTIPVLVHALEWLQKNEGMRPQYILLLEATSPFVTREQIDTAFKLMVAKKADSAKTVIRVPRVFHPYHVRRVTAGGFLVFDKPKEHYAHPYRQSDPPRFAHGNLWWFRRDAFLKKRQIEVGKRVGVEVDAQSAHGIDTPFDFSFGEFLYKNRKNKT